MARTIACLLALAGLCLTNPGCSGPTQQTASSTFAPVGAEVEYERGVEAYRDNDLEEAERHYRQAITINPRYLAAYLGLGRVLLEDQRYAEAQETFQQAVSIRDRSAEAHSGLAEALLELGMADQAAQTASRAIDLGASADGSLIYAQALDALGRRDEAITTLEQLVQSEPGRTDIRIELARLYVATDRKNEAVPVLERGARGAPNDYDAWLALAELYHQMEIWDRATECWQQLVRISGGSGYTLMRLGESQLRSGSHLLALQTLDQAIAAEPTLARAYILHGEAEIVRGYPDRAQRDVERALALAPDDLDVLVLLANVQERQNQLDQAIATLQTARERHPDALAPAAELARIYSEQGNHQQVIDVLVPVQDQIASDSTANLLLVNAYLAVQDVDAALQYLGRMTSAHTDNAELHRQLVMTALESPQQTTFSSSQLVTYAERALQLSGGQRLEYRLTYIDALINDNQRRRAREEIDSALRDIPNNPELIQRRNRVD
ncbi:MAG: tetratricopeptide repeat protein [Bradymonadales bacterium]|nr:tetratricopeptide repeat protein [Bradymonadales bacterium]